MLSIIVIVVARILAAQAQQTIIIEVSAGSHSIERLPVPVTLPKALPYHPGYQLVQKATGRRVPAQRIDDSTMVFIPETPIAAGTSRCYTLAFTRTAGPTAIHVEKQPHGLLVKAGRNPLFFYHTKEALPRSDSPFYYKRSGFIHPLYNPDGKIITDDFPVGHAHQHGIFMTWVNTRLRNSFIDFWNQHLQKGTVEHVKIMAIREGPVLTQLKLLLRHTSAEHGEVLQDMWTVTVFSLPGHFLFDLQSEQRNTTTDTLFLERYHYGGLALRGGRQWNPEDSTHFQGKWNIVTSEGLTGPMADQSHARWVSASGMIDGKRAGVTVFSHPSNFRYPQGIRIHPAMPYWCFAPVIDGEFNIPPAGVFRSSYRYLVYAGDPPAQMVEKIQADLTEPPLVRVWYDD